ncbi:MAG: CHAD domain-containing protein [Actinobacteria bacterium]|nr:CHAD domain-containing protein [Actinomycetota bacterium]
MEVEAKYTAADAATLARLAKATELAGYDVDAGERRRDRDTFLDTADRRFLAAGYYLRRRETGGGVRLTLKQLVIGDAGVLRREELEARVAADVPPAEWPEGELRERVQSIAQGAPLEPFLFLEQERLARRVFDGAREVAELSLDDVTIAAGGRARRWFEAELELRGEGDDDDLERLAAALRAEPGLTPESRAKFTRALEMVEAGGDGSLLPPAERSVHEAHAGGADVRAARRAAALLALDEGLTQTEAGTRAGLSSRRVRYWLARYRVEGLGIYRAPDALGASEVSAESLVAEVVEAPAEAAAETDDKKKRPGILPADTMVEAAVKTLRFHLARMLEHEAGTRLGEDSEELHVMRVSTRRMRMALRVFDEYLDRQTMRPVLKGLRRTGRTLGAVRDLDVFQYKTQHYLDTLPPERAGDLDGLLAACRAERERQREHLVDYLDGGRYRDFVERFAELLDGPLDHLSGRPPVDPRPQRVSQVLPGVLYKDMAVVWAFEGQIDGLETPLPRFHALRKGCKGLRYTLEFFEDVLGPGARPLIKKVKGLQDHLGDLQDAVVTSGVLRDYLTWGTWRHGGHDLPGPVEVIVAPGAARYLAARQEEMERLVLTFPDVWPTIAGSGFSRELATVIAEI